MNLLSIYSGLEIGSKTYLKYSDKVAYRWFKINNLFIYKKFLDLK